MSDNNIEIQHHEYDGIKEYDNPLPMWWLWTFFGTIIFAFIYYIHYEITGAPGIAAEYAAEVAEVEAQKVANAPSAESETEESLSAAMASPDVVKLGEATFNRVCAACHGPHLQGLIGPNLTDKYWIHGQGTRVDIIKVVREGVNDKGMPPWGGVLKPDEQYAVVAYILSKKGSNPAGAKEPQGNKIDSY